MTAPERLGRHLRALRAVWRRHHPDAPADEPDIDTLTAYGLHADDETMAEARALLDDVGFK